MRLRDLRGDMQAQPKALAAVANLAPKEGLEQPFHGCRRNGFSGIRDPELEHAALRFCAHVHWLVRGTMGKGIADQIRQKLSDPRAVAIDAFRQFEAGLDHALGRGRPQFVDDLLKDWLQRSGVRGSR